MLLVGYIVVMCLPYWVFVGISPLLYIKSLHVSLKFFGLYQGVLAFVFAVGSILFGFVVNRLPQLLWMKINFVIFGLSIVAIFYATFFASASPVIITIAMLIFVIGQIIPSIIVFPKCLNYFPASKGKTAALQQSGRLVFSIVALQITGYFYDNRFDVAGVIILLLVALVMIVQVIKVRHKHIVFSSAGDTHA